MSRNGGEGSTKPTTLQTVERALRFLEHVAAASPSPSVKDVSEALGVNIATGYHLLRTLVAQGYVERRGDGTLILGSSIGALFHAYQRGFQVDEALVEVVRGIARETSETAFLSTLDGANVIIKSYVEGSHQLRVGGLHVGRAGNELRRASGKAVLAHLESPCRDEIIERNLRSCEPAERRDVIAELEAELSLIRERGWAVDEGQSELGIIGIGAPVFGASGAVYGAVGLVTPTFRMERSADRFVAAVVAGASDASSLLVGRPTA